MEIANAVNPSPVLQPNVVSGPAEVGHQPGRSFFDRLASADRAKQEPKPIDHGANLITPEIRELASRGDSLLDSLGPMQRYLGNAQAIQARIDHWVSTGFVRPDDPRVMSAQGMANMELLKAQAAAQQYGLTVEVVSKIVEQATNGTRTILQTQT